MIFNHLTCAGAKLVSVSVAVQTERYRKFVTCRCHNNEMQPKRYKVPKRATQIHSPYAHAQPAVGLNNNNNNNNKILYLPCSESPETLSCFLSKVGCKEAEPQQVVRPSVWATNEKYFSIHLPRVL